MPLAITAEMDHLAVEAAHEPTEDSSALPHKEVAVSDTASTAEAARLPQVTRSQHPFMVEEL